MKIVSKNTGKSYHVEFTRSTGEERIICPECSHTRKKNKAKDLAWDHGNGIGYCHHHQDSFYKFKAYDQTKQFTVPEWKNITFLSDKAVKWFQGRMIKQEVLKEMKIYTDVEYFPQLKKEYSCICFPYFRDGRLINIKYRAPGKTFKMNAGSELLFYNIDNIIESKEVIITEGEIDALCFIQAGYKHTISVPNGSNKNLEYLDSSIELFEEKEKIYIAVDNDQAGVKLRNELIRRLGADKCYQVNLRDCKDANDFLIKYGSEFSNLIPEAKPVPVKGVLKTEVFYNELYDFYLKGVEGGLKIDMPEIDRYVTWETGRLAIITGVPSHGKSEFVDYVVAKLVLLHNCKAAYFTPENYPLKFHTAKLFEKLVGTKFGKQWTPEGDFDQGYNYINDNFYYILNEEDLTAKSILQSARYLVKTKGINILVIDPYNKVDHQYGRNQSETQYISWFLDQLISFAQFNNCLVFLVAHPRKMERENNNHKCPSLYDISGSAHFYNKADYGITIYRKTNLDNGTFTNDIELHFQKIKYKNLGEAGVSELRYNYINGRFEERISVDQFDESNWLTKKHVIPEQEDLPF